MARANDPETDALKRCVAALESVPNPDSRNRIAVYLAHRYYPPQAERTAARFGGNAEDPTGPDVTLAAADSSN